MTAASRTIQSAGPPRILFLTPSLLAGGAERIVAELALDMRARGWDVAVVSMLEPEMFAGLLQSHGIPVVSLGMSRGGANAGGCWRLLKYAAEFRPSLIHGHMFHGNILARALRLFWPVPVICTVHSLVESPRNRDSARFREFIYRITDWAASRTTAVSEAVRQRYIQERIVPAHRIETIGQGVDTEVFRPSLRARLRFRRDLGWEDEFIWLAAGRLELAKDYPNLIEAFRIAHQTNPRCRLAIAGQGSLRDSIENQVRAANLGSAVTFLGVRTDMPELMNASDGFVLASVWEGAPLVVLEAAACGLPVVSTRVGGTPDMVREGVTGILVPPRDSASLARAMCQLMAMQPDARLQMGEEARQHVVRRFSKRAMLDQYYRLYCETLFPQGSRVLVS